MNVLCTLQFKRIASNNCCMPNPNSIPFPKRKEKHTQLCLLSFLLNDSVCPRPGANELHAGLSTMSQKITKFAVVVVVMRPAGVQRSGGRTHWSGCRWWSGDIAADSRPGVRRRNASFRDASATESDESVRQYERHRGDFVKCYGSGNLYARYV